MNVHSATPEASVQQYAASEASRLAFIDGLRAVSIIAVVAFHVGIPGFHGGFIGVDVFFLISGYLIIAQIVRQVESKTFSIADFWARRSLRILPPLIILLCVSAAIASVVLITPLEISDFGASAVYSAAMLANHYFFWQQGYFATAADLKPLLHTWTLSVEEQFYLVAPLLIASILFVQRRLDRSYILLSGIAAITAVSFLACIAYTTPTNNAAFFLTPFRAWEFLIGGLIPALIPLALRIPPVWLERCAWLAAAAIGLAIVFFSERLLFPSYYAAVPVIGAAVLIIVGLAQPNSLVIRALASSPMRWIGLVSYSWYLWHWPLLSFTRIYNFGQRHIGADIAAGLISLVLAALTFYWVERPIRDHRPKGGRRLRLIGVLPVIALALVGSAVFLATPMVERRAQTKWDNAALPKPIGIWWTTGDACSLDPLPIEKLNPDCINQPWVKSFGLLMGDSHAMTAFSTLKDEARKRDIQLLTRVDGSCLPLLKTVSSNKGVPMASCIEGMRQAVDALAKELPGRVPFAILKASWTGMAANPISRERPDPSLSDAPLDILVDRLRLTIELLQQIGVKRVLVVGPEPLLARGNPTCLFRADHFGFDRSVCNGKRADMDKYLGATNSALAKSVAGNRSVRFIDAIASLCDASTCPASVDGNPVYVDGAHLTPAGERHLFNLRSGDLNWALGEPG